MTDIEERKAFLAADPSKPYFIRYNVEFGRFGKEENAEGWGLTQDIIIVSCITHADGSYSQNWIGHNGQENADLHSNDVFKAWIMMAASLRDKKDLNENRRKFVDVVFETYLKVRTA